MRNVVSAVEVVVDKYFPVAVDVVRPAVKVVQFAHAQRRHSLDQPAKKILEWESLRIQIHEDKLFPGFRLHRDQPVLPALKIFHAVEFRHALQGPIQTVVPAMIGTMQNGRLPARLSHHRRGMMAAYVVKAAQHSVIAADHHNWLPGDAGSHKLARFFHLLHASYHLPGLAENGLGLELRDSGVHVPGRGNGGSIRQRSLVVVLRQDFSHRHVPVVHAPIALCSTSRN